MQNRHRSSFLCIMAMACAAAIIGCGTPSIKDSDTVMEIAGQPIVKAEYQMVLKSHVAEVKRQYTTEEANAADFWEMERDGVSPGEQAMELAREDLAHKKVVAYLAQEAGIQEPADYLSIMEEMGEENAERKGKASAGEVVYGLTSFAAEDYYSYVYTNLESQLMEKLKSGRPISDEELKKIYQENQEPYTSEVRVQMLVGEIQAWQGADADMETAQLAKGAMEEGAGIEALAEQFPEIRFYELELSSLNTEEGKSGAYAQRWMTASMMEEGQVCEPFLIGQNIMVMRCQKREEHVAEPFEKIKGILKSEVQTRLAQEEIEKGVQEAEVSFQEETLRQAAMEALEGET